MAQVVEIDVLSGEVTQRDFTVEEQAQREADLYELEALAAERAAVSAARESARQKIATASGLTPEEMRALGFAV